ncbi:MAG: threonine/serine exporter family protein [Eubacteriales bacterium]|nr:threonine/serine exporter family protein [Eubacteriales bacterium]
MLTWNFVMQLITCTLGCIGFGMMFKVHGMQLFYSGVGAFFTWIFYCLVLDGTNSNFQATWVGSAFVAVFAEVMARVNRAPATIFLTTSVFPVVPGKALYNMMYYLVMKDYALSKESGWSLLMSCLGIALGFIAVEIPNKYLTMLNRKRKGLPLTDHMERY